MQSGKKGKRTKNALKLNGGIREVPTYKYLGEMMNNKGSPTHQIAGIEKVKGATIRILTEAENKELKGKKMWAIWQMVETIIILILTYACEHWVLHKEDKKGHYKPSLMMQLKLCYTYP